MHAWVIQIMLLVHFARLLPFIALIHGAPSRYLTADPTASSSLPIIIILSALFLIALVCYDKRQGYRWGNTIRHSIGECIRMLRQYRQYRKKNGEKSLRIQTDEALPTPKATHITEADNERPFIEAEPNSVLHEPLTSPNTDPMAQQELQEGGQEVDMKNVFQVRESKKGSGKPKKEKKSKSKLKSRLQSHEEEEKEGEEDNSFSEEVSVDEGTTRGTEVQ